MPRISNQSFKVNDALQQQVELSAVDASVTIPISTSFPLDVTSNLAEVHGEVITLGQKTSAKSLPVTLPSDQAGLNVTSNIAEVQGVPINLGKTTKAQSFPVVLPSDDSMEVTANISEIHGSAITLGQKPKAASLPVTLASDEDTLNINISEVGLTSISLDQKVTSKSFPVVIASDQSAVGSNIYYVDDNAKINDAETTKALQVGMYGWNGSKWQQANVNSAGNLKVESEIEQHSGFQGNLASSSAYTDGSNSAVINVSNKTLLTLFGDKTDTSNSFQPQISADNTNWYDLDWEVYPKFNGDFYQNIDNIAVNYFRLKFTGAGTATATLLSNNH